MMGHWLGIVIVLVILGVLLAALGHMSHRHHPEVLRKSLHVGMGLVTLSFPWLFACTWPVLLLACLCTLAFAALYAFPALKLRLGASIHRVSRVSLGEMHFVLGTVAVYMLTAGDALMFCIPMLVLTFADAAAALIGTWYGRHRFAASHGSKTVEGSAAFFIVTLACTYLPLALFAPADDAGHAAAAVLVAAVATALEAATGRGLDNLVVPVGAWAALTASGASAGLAGAGGYAPGVSTELLAAIALLALVGLVYLRRVRGAQAEST